METSTPFLITGHHEEIRNLLLAGAAGISFFFLLWRTYLAHQDTKTKKKEENTNKLNQINKAYTDAIDQLSNDKITIRLGGAYALEQLAQNNQSMHSQIMEVLCSYVRLNSPSNIEKPEEDKNITLDIQTILTIIGRRNHEFDKEPLDLSGSNLRKANLEGANLEGANLLGADLFAANLENAKLQKANLQDANLTGANLEGANLLGADLFAANLFAASLRDAINLTCKQLKEAKNWEQSYRNLELACGAEIPEMTKEDEELLYHNRLQTP